MGELQWSRSSRPTKPSQDARSEYGKMGICELDTIRGNSEYKGKLLFCYDRSIWHSLTDTSTVAIGRVEMPHSSRMTALQ